MKNHQIPLILINAIFIQDMSNLNLENIEDKNNKGFIQNS